MEPVTNEWYQRWFGAEYLDVYPHRDQAEANNQVSFIIRELSLTPQSRILDIACGAGRHLLALAAAGMTSLHGIDYSETLLVEAQKQLNEFSQISLIRGDMRQLPFADASFDVALSLFTSFGYFATDEEHRLMLSEWHRVLTPQGHLVLDYANRDNVINNLQGETVDTRGTKRIEQTRALSPLRDRIIKEINIFDSDTDTRQRFRESVRLYSEAELDALLAAAGFRIENKYGNLAGAKFSNESDRLVIFARAN